MPIKPWMIVLAAVINIILLVIVFVLFKRSTKLKSNILENKERLKYLMDSILTISKATIAQQCEISEACIRLNYLFGQLQLDVTEIKMIHPIVEANLQFQQFDYLENRAKLSAQEKYRQDTQRFEIEQRVQASILECCRIVVEHFQPKLDSIST